MLFLVICTLNKIGVYHLQLATQTPHIIPIGQLQLLIMSHQVDWWTLFGLAVHFAGVNQWLRLSDHVYGHGYCAIHGRQRILRIIWCAIFTLDHASLSKGVLGDYKCHYPVDFREIVSGLVVCYNIVWQHVKWCLKIVICTSKGIMSILWICMCFSSWLS